LLQGAAVDPAEWSEITVDGLRLVVPGRFLTSYVDRAYEPLTMSWIRSGLTPESVVVDVGAHLGFLTCSAARIAVRGRVIALEPAAENCLLLRHNVELNKLANVEVIDAAVSDSVGTRVFHVTGSSDSHGFYVHPLTPTHREETVATTTVDAVLDGTSADLVKIDVEGAEIEVLRGSSRTLATSPAVRVVAEWNPACVASAGFGDSDLPDALRDMGFRPRVLDELYGRERTVTDVLADIRAGRLEPWWYANLVCDPR
jgi:FkbM family methyltransferase